MSQKHLTETAKQACAYNIYSIQLWLNKLDVIPQVLKKPGIVQSRLSVKSIHVINNWTPESNSRQIILFKIKACAPAFSSEKNRRGLWHFPLKMHASWHEMVAWDAPWSHLLLQCVRFFYFRVMVVPRGLFLVHTYIAGVLVRLRWRSVARRQRRSGSSEVVRGERPMVQCSVLE